MGNRISWLLVNFKMKRRLEGVYGKEQLENTEIYDFKEVVGSLKGFDVIFVNLGRTNGSCEYSLV